MTGAEEVAWDLTDLYGSPEDPQFEQDMAATRDRVRAFRERYRGRVGELGAPELAEALGELDEIEAAHVRAAVYAHLLFATDTADPVRGALLQRSQEWSASLETDLLFAQLEWAAVPDERAEELLREPALERWSHFLRALRRFRPHLLSEPEETILTEKSVSGQGAWARLFSELTSALRAPIDGEEVPFEQALARMYSPDRDVRRTAAEGVVEGLRPGLRTRAYVFNTLLLDKSIDDRLRTYSHWLAARNLSNEISDEAVEALVAAVVSRYDIPQRYYRLKARLLGLGERMAYYDRMAPVSSDESKLSWDEARDLVLEAYAEFSDEAGRIVSDFFERSWIDAPVRPNKRNGAFCVTRVPGVHPYVLMNFTGDRRSVLTLAHELGHGLHGALAQPLGALNADTPLTLAETASVFGEALTFDRLVAADDDPARRLDLLIGRLDDGMATVFRQIAMNRFEHAVHTERREEGELAPDRFGEHWIATQRAMLGEAVDLDGYELWWSYVPHYVVSPGYVYAYTFGYLFSLAIFRNWQRQGDALVEPYLDLLRAGGSRTPDELAGMVGLDLSSDRIWHDGLEALDEVMGQAEELAATLA